MKHKIVLLPIAILVMAVLACNFEFQAAPTLSQQQIETLSAQTMIAIQWQTLSAGGNTPGVLPGDTPISPGGAADTPTYTMMPTVTPTGTLPPSPTHTPSVTLTPVPCNWAQFIADVTVADNWETGPLDHFTKTWRLKNIGSCTWTSGYSLVFDHGDQMDAPDSQQLTTGTVAPGATIDVSVNLLSPAAAGTYQGYFKLRASDSSIFGIGPGADGAFWVKIKVATAALTVQQVENQTDVTMGTVGNVSVNCPAGTVVVGGGFDGGNNIGPHNSGRSGNGWVVYGHRYEGANSVLKVYAYCLSGVSASSTSGFTDKTLTPGTYGEVTSNCSGGSVVSGGGYAFTDGKIWAYRLDKVGSGLRMNAKNIGATDGVMRSHPVCLSTAGAVTVQATNMANVPASSTGTVEAACPPGTVLTGGGFVLSTNMRLTGLYRKPGENTWVAKALNPTGSNLNLVANGICLAIS